MSSVINSIKSKIPRQDLITLEQTESGTLLFDSGADTGVAGKHAWVVEVVEGITASARGFDETSKPIEDLPIVNVVYAYDRPDTGEVLLLEYNHQIYMGDRKSDSIACPNQMRLHGIFVDEKPTFLIPDAVDTQCIIADGLKLPLLMNGPLAYLPIRRPTITELTDESRHHICMTSPHGWDPYGDDSITPYNSATLQDYSCAISTFLSRPLKNLILNVSSNQRQVITLEQLMSRWGVGKETAKRTLNATWQEYTRATDNLTRRFKTTRVHSRYRQLLGPYSVFYTDTLFSNILSLRGNTCGQVYFNKANFYKFYPMKTKGDAHTTLIPLLELAGMPSSMHSDRAPELITGKFRELLNKYRIRQSMAEAKSPWQNQAEGQGVKPIKRLGLWLMERANAPSRTWDFAFELAANILSLTCKPNVVFGEQTGYQSITNIRPDISQYASFAFYQWIWHWDELKKQKQLGRWLGVAENVGPIMTFWILPSSGIPIPRSSVIPLSPHEYEMQSIKERMYDFRLLIKSKVEDTTNFLIKKNGRIDTINDINVIRVNRSIQESYTSADLWDGDKDSIPYEPTSDESAMEELDEHIGQQIQMIKNDAPILVRIASRKRDEIGKLVGEKHDVPQLDSRVYNVEYPDGHFEQYSLNVLTEALNEMVDHDGYDKSFVKEVCGYRRDETLAVPKERGFTKGHNGRSVPVITTKGWSVKIRWMDDAVTWVPLNVMKNSQPLILAQYAKTMKIDTEPAFLWWVPHVLRKSSRLLSKVKTLFHKNNLKFGIEVPKSVKDALRLDNENGNTFWKDAINKEMTNVKVAFKFANKNSIPPPGFKQIRCHIIFDVKMDLTRKARFVAGGHLTDPPTAMTYASVVSRESVRIAFLLAALNDLEILSGDIGNAYLNAYTQEKIYYRAGLEWGAHMEGTICVIVRALYGLKTSANAWRSHLCTTLKDMGFKFSLADNDLWLRKDVRPGGTEYYSYILVYVDDILICSHDPVRYMTQLTQRYYVKKDSIGPPNIYLGATYKKVTDRSGKQAWASSSDNYVKEATKVAFKRADLMGIKLDRKAKSPKNPFSNIKYRPELDVSVQCTTNEHQFYQQLIGMARWAIELGRLDINVEISILSRYMAAPRTGHLAQLLHIFYFLHSHNCMDLIYDPTKIQVVQTTILPYERAEFKSKLMKDLYPDAIDYLPPNAPPSLGESVQINAFVDADLAGEQTTRRSQTGIIIYMNMAPIIWVSKRQNTVEASTFGSEMVALRAMVELIIGLRYKLRMFGIPIDGPCNVFCDNEAVTKSAMNPSTTLKRKHISISFHQVREAVAAGIMLVFHEGTKTNHSDLFTKILNSMDRKRLMHFICGKSQ